MWPGGGYPGLYLPTIQPTSPPPEILDVDVELVRQVSADTTIQTQLEAEVSIVSELSFDVEVER